jgi:two-component system C4-dicarboxylate transport response regulator DctD
MNKNGECNKIIFIDDDDDLRKAQVQGLGLEGFEVFDFDNGEAALKFITPDFTGIVVTDIRMPNINGIEVFQQIQKTDPEIPVILITGHGDIDLVVSAMKDGAYDVLSKPYSFEYFLQSIMRAIQKRALIMENRRLKALSTTKNTPFENLLGESRVMQNLRNTLSHIAKVDVDVLLTGESGTGKTLIAKSIHLNSGRRKKNYLNINCSIQGNALFETDSDVAKRGTISLLEKNHGGTIHLQDIEHLSTRQQAQLFHLLESKEYIQPQSGETRFIDVRIIASTTIDLSQLVAEGKFRADLFYRLSGVSLIIPPLRERKQDILSLFYSALMQSCSRLRVQMPEISQGLIQKLENSEWKGNVRELEQYAERVAIGISDASFSEDKITESHDLNIRLNAFEAKEIKNALIETSGNVIKAIALLNIPRRTFYDKINKHGINPEEYRK